MSLALPRNIARALHDLGLFAWFGGALMGIVGLNGASSELSDPRDRGPVVHAGWQRWNPASALAIASYVAGAVSMIQRDPDSRPKVQQGILTNDVAKIAASVTAGVGTVTAGIIGNRIAQASQSAPGGAPIASATEPGAGTPPDVASLQRRQKIVQWLVPLGAGAAILLSSGRAEMEKPSVAASGLLGGLAARARALVS